MQNESTMKQERITFKNSKGQKLVGILYSPGSKNAPVAIFVHGYRSDKTNSKAKTLSYILPSKGISLFSIDLSGRGESEGKFEDTTITQYIDDLKCAIDGISKYTDKIAVIGSSLGGLVSLQESIKDKRVNALVLLSPISHFPHKSSKDFTQENVKKWKEKGYIYTHSDRFGEMKINYTYYEDGLRYGDYSVYNNIKIPVLIIHGTEDESVLIKDSEELIKHLKNAKLIPLRGADHRYTKEEDFNKVTQETSKFIEEELR